MSRIHGIHHVTAIAGDARQNLDFYAGVLGMRLVKRSVNQDDPGTYHLFYADAAGTPGTDLTFFPWPRLAPRRKGVGLTVEVALAVPAGSLPFWADRLRRAGVTTAALESRFDRAALPFTDPHGLELAMVESAEPRPFAPWERGPVPAAHQIRGLHGVRLWERDRAATARLLEEVMGLSRQGEQDGWHRFAAGPALSGGSVEIRELPGERRGSFGTGGVHHVAWRVTDEAEQLRLRERLLAAGMRPTGVIDRFWFRSVYFLEPGGALFELATDGPGFAVDEPPDALGERLVLPPWLEPRRREIEAVLPPLELGPAAVSQVEPAGGSPGGPGTQPSRGAPGGC